MSYFPLVLTGNHHIYNLRTLFFLLFTSIEQFLLLTNSPEINITDLNSVDTGTEVKFVKNILQMPGGLRETLEPLGPLATWLFESILLMLAKGHISAEASASVSTPAAT